MNNEIESIEIRPAKNGGFTARHNFAPKPVVKRGAMNGGFYMERPAHEDHAFGKHEGPKFLTHVARAMRIRARVEEETGYEGRSSAGNADSSSYGDEKQ
jgi:hypothetical protein